MVFPNRLVIFVIRMCGVRTDTNIWSKKLTVSGAAELSADAVLYDRQQHCSRISNRM